jgi:hypothetical protein
MPYYGDYYRGDYYRGDPGILGFIGKAVGTIGRIGAELLPGPVGTVARKVTSALPRFGPAQPSAPPMIVPPAVAPMPALPRQTGTAMVPMAAAGGACQVRGYHPNKAYSYAKGMPPGSYCVKNRKTNYGNVRALRRADRRIDGFVRIARSALKHTNYKVVSRSAGKRGSRGVITRSEAARALRS